jgi:glucose-fructose oxidoreductase
MAIPPSGSLSRRRFLHVASVGSTALFGGAPLRAWAEAMAGNGGRPLGVALLGLGMYSEGQLGPSLRETKLCRLAGVVTGHPEKAARWAREYGLPEKNLYSYETLDRIADNPDIDIVYVVTPPALHREFVVRAAKAGKHVISEKPLATSVEDCEAMIAACREAKVRFSVGYRLFFEPHVAELRRLARDGDFGPLTKMTGEFGFVFGERAWRVDKKLAGGGPMMDLGIYLIQAACMAQDGAAPVAVTAHELPKKRPELFNEVEETMRFGLEFADGARLDALASFNQGGDSFRAEGAGGWIDFRPHAFAYRGIGCVTSRGTFDAPIAVHEQALQMDGFAKCVMTGERTPVPGEMGLRDIRILEAIYEAARTGRRTPVA